MTALRKPKMTVDDYLAWSLDQPEPLRADLIDGEVYAQASQRVGHVRAKVRAVNALDRAVRNAGLACDTLGDGVLVRVSETTAFEPDALVYCGDPLPGDAVEAPNPVIVVEVLSPGSEARDMRDKLAGYFQVPSVMHYLIVDTDEKLVIHHARQQGETLSTRILREGEVRLDPPGIVVSLGDMLA
jgi:Uma2 family endonuclease